jgi:HlyD family secretion protein
MRSRMVGGPGAGIAAVVSLVLLSTLVSACSSTPTPAPVTRVQRGTVATKVSASGALAAVTSQNLGFPKAAQLKELDVKVGDQVRPGQVLARLDDFAFRQALAQQQAQLDQQRAALNKIVNSNSVHAAEATMAQAKKILSATKDSVTAQEHADSSAVDRARVQLDFDRAQLTQARQRADAACGSAGHDATGTAGTGGADSGGGSATQSPSTSAPGGSGFAVRGWRSPRAFTDPGAASDGSSTSGTGGAGSSAATGGADATCASATQAVSTAQRQVITSQTALDTAKRTREVNQASGRVTVENARQSVVSAQNTVDSARTDRPSDIQGQDAAVANVQAAVALAQRDVDNAVLYAPVGGTVSAINGTVGEFVGSANAGTTALAPGTDASIPGVGAAATSDQAGNNGPSATRPGGSAFLVLNNIDTFQIVVPFEESDAVKVGPNQQVDVTFDAVPGLTRRGTVLSVAPGGVNISGVTNYYATILLNETDPRLRNGLTAEAAVLTNALNSVLVVPNAAVSRQGNQTFVTIRSPDGKPVRIPFQAGAVGDDTTQVLSGLTEGQVILMPQTPASPSGTGSGTGGAGRGGAG